MRHDKDNKVRLVRDKLYVNGKEVNEETYKNDTSYKMKDPPGRERGMKQKWQNNTVYGRTIYSSRHRNPKIILIINLVDWFGKSPKN